MKQQQTYPLLFFAIIFFAGISLIKASPSDSLLKIIKNSKSDSNKVNALIELSRYSKGDSFIITIDEAVNLAQKLDYKKGIAAGHLALGKYHYKKENYSISLLHCITAFNIAKEIRNNEIMAWACLYIGFNNYLSQPDISLKYYFKSIEHCRSSDLRSIAAYGYSAIGNVYEARQDADVALRYYNMSLQIRMESGSPVEKVSSLIETARVFNQLQDYDKSTALINKALMIAEANEGNEQNLVYLYEMTGHDIAGRLKDYRSALGYFQKSFNLAGENNLSQSDIVKPIAETYFKLGEYENSARYFKIYNDKLEQHRKKRLRELLKAEDVIKKEMDNEMAAALAAEQEMDKINTRQQQTYRNIYIAGIILLIVFLFLIYRNNRLKEKLNLKLEQEVKERTSDLEILNDKLLLSEKRLMDTNKELESFIYQTSHDLKGPLASSKGLVNLALSAKNPDEIPDYVKMIGKTIDKLDMILVALYEVSVIRKGTVLLKEIDLEGLINSLLQNLSGADNYSKIKFTVSNELKKAFRSDEILTQTVLRNLLENAVKYSQFGIPDPFVTITLAEEGLFFVVTIADNGIGISPDYQAKIFDPFVRATGDRKGTGLGLYIVKNAMDKLGGKIELVKSEPYNGSVFKLYFPM